MAKTKKAVTKAAPPAGGFGALDQPAPPLPEGTALAVVHPQAEGFREKVTPKPVEEKLFLFSCKCGGAHFRHAGYVELMLPFLKPDGDKRMAMESHSVKVCVKCRKAYVWVDSQMYDVSDRVDLKAWEKFEVEAQKATGPGGDC